jgi:hypothetical protein
VYKNVRFVAYLLLFLISEVIINAVGIGKFVHHHMFQINCYHHAPTVKPEAATAVVELLMMGVRMPETC